MAPSGIPNCAFAGISDSTLYLEPGKAWDKVRQLPKFSVLIPVRDEAANIGVLLNDLSHQEYPSGCFEVIVINDHSSDATEEIVQKMRSELNLRLLHLPEGSEGKKKALELGVKEASGELILATDGDCRVGPHWISSFASAMTEETQLVFGPVRILSNSIFEKIQALDFSILVGYAASLVKVGKPSMSNGANIAYRRSVFEEMKGYEGNHHIPTGDDEFLLLKVVEQYPDGIRFLKDRSAVVSTRARPTFGELLDQRKRWLSKWSLHKNFYIMASVLVILLDNLALLMGWAFLILGWLSPWFLVLFGLRTLIKLNFSFSVNRVLGSRTPLGIFVLYELIYPVYVVFLSLSSIFGDYTWKGRRYS